MEFAATSAAYHPQKYANDDADPPNPWLYSVIKN